MPACAGSRPGRPVRHGPQVPDDGATGAGRGRGGRTRTDDLVLPKHVRYQLRHTPTIVREYRTILGPTVSPASSRGLAPTSPKASAPKSHVQAESHVLGA